MEASYQEVTDTEKKTKSTLRRATPQWFRISLFVRKPISIVVTFIFVSNKQLFIGNSNVKLNIEIEIYISVKAYFVGS